MIKSLSGGFLLVLALAYSSCKKDAKPQFTGPTYHIVMPDSADSNPVNSASLDVYAITTGQAVPADYLGFSFEKQVVTDTTYFNAANTTFINLFKNLGSGLIRIGGSSVDKTFWSAGRRSSSVTDSVYTNDVSRYTAFAQSVGWKTIWGLNLGTGDPVNDAAEAKYVTNSLGNQIASFAIGNEPAYYYESGLRPASYNYLQYLGDFDNFSNTIRQSVPNVIFSGPENEPVIWGLSFMQPVSSRLNLLSVHYYRMGPPGSAGVTTDALLTFDLRLNGLLSATGPAAQAMHLSYRITECNSVDGGGQPGISNAYAASLWGSEFLFYMAQQGAAGVNFHTGGTPNYVYSPISTVNGKSVARPLYYSMLLFHQANISQFTKSELANPSRLNMDAYSFITRDNKRGVMVINKDTINDLSITLNTANPIQKATAYELIGPSLSSLTGTNINGSIVNADGTFSVNGHSFILSKKYSAVLAKVKAASAMLIILD